MKSITLRVRHSKDGYLETTYRGIASSRVAFPIELAGQRVPRKRYRVRYALTPKGALIVRGNGYVQNPSTGRGYQVCFLPFARSRRVSRTVLPW